MALIKCPECGNKISDQAASCPKCGYELNKSNQEVDKQLNKIKGKWDNKYLLIIVAAVIAFLLFNQNKTQSNNGGGTPTPSPSNNGYMVYTDQSRLSFEYPSNYKVIVGKDGYIYVAKNVSNQSALIPYVIIGKYNKYNNETRFLTDFTNYLRQEYSDLQITIDLLSGIIGNRTVYGIAYNYTSSGHLIVDNRYAVLINNAIYMIGSKEENTNTEEINNVVSHIIETMTEGGK